MSLLLQAKSDIMYPMNNFSPRDRRPSRYSDNGPRPEMHKAVCDACGKDCDLPFKPTGSKPVYCRDCFKKEGGGTENRYQARAPRRSNFDRRDDERPQKNIQLEAIERKLDKILKLLTPNE